MKNILELTCATDAPLGGNGEPFTVRFDTATYPPYELVLLPSKALIIAWQQDLLVEFGGHASLESRQCYADKPENWNYSQFKHLPSAFRPIESFSPCFKKERLELFKHSDSYEAPVLGDRDGEVDFINGRHRTRLLYEVGIENMPVLLSASNKEPVKQRVLGIDRCLRQGELITASPMLNDYQSESFSPAARAKETLLQQKMTAPEDSFINVNLFQQHIKMIGVSSVIDKGR